MKALDIDIDADNGSAQVHHVTVNTNSIQFDGCRIYPANRANCHHPGLIAIQGFHTVRDGCGGCTDNPRASARPCQNPRRCPERVPRAADETSEPGSYKQDGDRGCALPGAGGRAMTSGTPNTLFPPQLKNIQDVHGVPTDGENQRKRSDSCHTVEIRDVWEHAEGNKCAASGAHGRGGSHHARLPLFFHGSHVGLTPGLLLTVSRALFLGIRLN